ncbi:hypothetical protein SISNIDRAFT_488773 [Sistotremastrum niveocremeum HHB9708]|uniref:Uncharacterized protein n=1 Tax=Sistotremastrum niveocremeum HHB9708 TaxID=1314777 RepID=A0A164QRY7_9AGAM|nr:hypothetical protein SISNIDRAFT_488773 [Sistotremastrum niveocremeum HHB9708]
MAPSTRTSKLSSTSTSHQPTVPATMDVDLDLDLDLSVPALDEPNVGSESSVGPPTAGPSTDQHGPPTPPPPDCDWNISGSPASKYGPPADNFKCNGHYRDDLFEAALDEILKTSSTPSAADPATFEKYKMVRPNKSGNAKGILDDGTAIERASEFLFNVAGEIGYKNQGVALGPMGTHGLDEIIDSKRFPKGRIVLNEASLPVLCNDQASEIHAVVVKAESQFRDEDQPHLPPLTEEGRDEYFIERVNKNIVGHCLRRKDRLFSGIELSTDAILGFPTGTRSGGLVSSAHAGGHGGQEPETAATARLSLNRTYPLSYWPQIEGKRFNFTSNTRILQLPFYDTQGNLIAPWDMARVLRPGTVIVARCALVMWNFRNQKPLHKYQLKIRKLRVYDYSLEEAENHSPPTFIVPSPSVVVEDAPASDSEVDERPAKRRRIQN